MRKAPFITWPPTDLLLGQITAALGAVCPGLTAGSASDYSPLPLSAEPEALSMRGWPSVGQAVECCPDGTAPLPRKRF